MKIFNHDIIRLKFFNFHFSTIKMHFLALIDEHQKILKSCYNENFCFSNKNVFF